MNVSLEINLFIDEEDFGPEEIERLATGASDFILGAGYGNIAAEEVEDTKLKSVIVVRPVKPNAWQARAKEAMAVNFPTADEEFLFQAEAGGIRGVSS